MGVLALGIDRRPPRRIGARGPGRAVALAKDSTALTQAAAASGARASTETLTVLRLGVTPTLAHAPLDELHRVDDLGLP